MEPRIDVITLAVADLDRALAFCGDGLGLESRGIVGTEFAGDEIEPDGAVAMFELQGRWEFALPRSPPDAPHAPYEEEQRTRSHAYDQVGLFVRERQRQGRRHEDARSGQRQPGHDEPT